MRLLHRPAQPNKVLPTAHSQWERDELEASAARMRSQYLQTDKSKIKPNPRVGKTGFGPDSLRARIKALSLFPNTYNRSYLMKEGATTS
jgi:hypothetical protein